MIATAQQEPHGSLGEPLEQYLQTELLRFTTAGSVDDGKSTLIGRLLHDSKAVYEDQLASVKKSRVNRSTGPIDFSLLTDGLRAEREQGITIDVAYRYFATPRRKFIIADTPGHEQYTRNMATGASTSDLAVILVDATKGILPQTRRHAYIASLLGIRSVLAAVNKMDLVDFSEDVFLRLEQDILQLMSQLGIAHTQSIPISALAGDNVVDRSSRTDWYQGPTLLEHLETVPVTAGDGVESLRFPVQMVIRPDANFRGFAGRLASGVIRPGDDVVALPSGRKTRVRSIVTYDGDLPEAFAPMSVTLQLEDEIDLSRGDMLVSPEQGPQVSKRFHARVVWLYGTPMEIGRTYLVKHTARQTKIRALQITHRVNIHTLEPEHATQLNMNDIASVEFEAHAPLFFDPYKRNRATGSFILIDPISNATVGAGMIQEFPADQQIQEEREIGFPENARNPVSAEERYRRHGHHPAIFLLENRPAVASKLERALFERGFEVLLLGGNAESSNPILDAIRTTQRMGAVAIYFGDALNAEAKERLAAEANPRLYEISRQSESASDKQLFLRGLALANSLWLVKRQENQEEAN
ncbi:MAG TPA: sulfate adenylyltransferase subunit CysN [Candidatus Acidoferrum sp.]|nr:sulfate adenylyltransferase subunit CysN [Candidatus Acidoferrum sp.]